tara:strand:- start:221 stop:895 length:675 start_codon:yes stop_codon:yes gene_type:complete
MKSYKKKFIEFIVGVNAIQFGEFTLKNGRESPYFFSTSKFNTGSLIDELGTYYAAAIEEHVPDCNLIFGPAYKGIPLCVSSASALSKRLNKDIGYFFNRKEEKNHGDLGSIVGQSPCAKDLIVMVDDVITDGRTKIESIDLIRELCEVEIKGIIVALDRMEKNAKGDNLINEFQHSLQIPVWSIITIREIYDYLRYRKFDRSQKLNKSIYDKIEKYLSKFCVQP